MSDAPPPPYEDAKHIMYPNMGAPQPNYEGNAYQPNMNNPYPAAQSAPPPQYPTHFEHQHSHQHLPSPQPQTFVYVSDQMRFGSAPMSVTCPHCQQQVVSKVRYSAGLLAWIIFAVFLLFGCWLGCCLIPFCLESCQDCEHYCSNCNAFLGHYKRL